MDDKFLLLVKDAVCDEFFKVGVVVNRILLFGSRARGVARQDSDWDFCVVIDKGLLFPEKNGIIYRIKRRLAYAHQTMDIIVKTQAQLDSEKGDWGRLAPYILEEGVPV